MYNFFQKVFRIEKLIIFVALLKSVFKALNHSASMANHKSSEKRIRQDEGRKENNKYFSRTSRNALKKLRSTRDKSAAAEMLPGVTSMLDKLAKKNIIHPNKAANLKSKLTKQVNSLS